MNRYARWAPFLILILCALPQGFAANSAIGLAIADGNFQLDHSNVWGNATLFDGNVIETSKTASQLRLNNGTRVRLAAESRARVYESRLVLEKGIGQLESPNYRIEADGMLVTADRPDAAVRVEVSGPNRIIVAAHEGAAQVSNSSGVLIARLNTGHEMEFAPQESGAGSATKISGILALKDGKFILVDRVTNVTMQLQGAGLEAEVGNLVEVTGTVDVGSPSVPGASQLINVTKIKRLVKSAASADRAAAGAAGAGAAGAAAGGGLSTGAVVAIVGGVAAAGTVGGLAAAHELPGQSSSPSSTSR